MSRHRPLALLGMIASLTVATLPASAGDIGIRTVPSITASRNIAPNAAGWNRTDVTITWSCQDDQPGAVLSEDTFTFTSEGANLSHTVTCVDVDDNEVSDTQYVNIDRTAPLTDTDTFTGGDLRGTATDNLSGVASTTVTWSVVDRHTTDAVCFSGCGSSFARWRATPPAPRPSLYQAVARSVDRAGNIGPASSAEIVVARP